MSTKINDDSMSLEIGDRVIATAEFSEHAAANGHGASAGRQDRPGRPGLSWGSALISPYRITGAPQGASHT
jgi:hypothetical protein